MPLNENMLNQAKDVIYNKSDLPESNKEPVHIAVKTLFTLEYSYKDFLSREMAALVSKERVRPILDIIHICGGDPEPFANWFMGYENPVEIQGMETGAEPTPQGAWGS